MLFFSSTEGYLYAIRHLLGNPKGYLYAMRHLLGNLWGMLAKGPSDRGQGMRLELCSGVKGL
jgi:hypothetical protein